MRIREEPLKAITEIDVISMQPFNAKKLTDDILIHILDTYILKQDKIDLINGYLKKRTLQNEDGLSEFIDMILEEKSIKKRKRST